MSRAPTPPSSPRPRPPAEDESDLWFLPGPPEDQPQPPAFRGRAEPWAEPGPLGEWLRAQAGQAAQLAQVAGRLGALDERLRRGPEGWRHRLALIEAADLGWLDGARVAPDRLALWLALRLAGVQDDSAALARVGWAARRLTGGPGPEPDLAAFLGRHDPGTPPADPHEDAPLAERAETWLARMHEARALSPDLHPIVRAAMGFHLWPVSGLSPAGERLEAAVTAARIAAPAGYGATPGAVFAPLAASGGAGLRPGGTPAERLARWLAGMDAALLGAMRRLDRIEGWQDRAARAIRPLSGRTPPALLRVLTEWPLVSAPMAEALTGSSRAAVGRNLAWMQAQGLIAEITGQGRFRMWRAAD